MLKDQIKAVIPEKLANEMDLIGALWADGEDDHDPPAALVAMVHKVNDHHEGNIVRFYRFIKINRKFGLKSELAAFSLPNAISATSFAENLLQMTVEELFVTLEAEGGKMAVMAPDLLL